MLNAVLKYVLFSYFSNEVCSRVSWQIHTIVNSVCVGFAHHSSQISRERMTIWNTGVFPSKDTNPD